MSPRPLLLGAALLAAVACVAKSVKQEPVENPKYTFPHSTQT